MNTLTEKPPTYYITICARCYARHGETHLLTCPNYVEPIKNEKTNTNNN